MRTLMTMVIIVLGVLFIVGIIIPNVKDSLINFDLNGQKHITKLVWSMAQLIAIAYTINRRFSKNK